jgi:hypothetical protein
VTKPVEVDPLEREIMLMLVDDDSTPLTTILGTLRTMTDLPSEVPVTPRVVKDALRRLMEKGLAKLVYYDPRSHEPLDTDISFSRALSLLDHPETWIPPIENPSGLQVRAIDTELGRELFF